MRIITSERIISVKCAPPVKSRCACTLAMAKPTIITVTRFAATVPAKVMTSSLMSSDVKVKDRLTLVLCLFVLCGLVVHSYGMIPAYLRFDLPTGLSMSPVGRGA